MRRVLVKVYITPVQAAAFAKAAKRADISLSQWGREAMASKAKELVLPSRYGVKK